MSSYTVVQVSDTHLSRTHGYFYDNWLAFLAEMETLAPDLVLHSGDLSFNAPDAPEDLDFAKSQMDRLRCEWLALPGNHDIGEPGEHPRLGQSVNAERLGHWARCFGADRFCRDLGEWRLIGINSELLGSGLPEENAQDAFLEQTLASAGARPIGLFLHKPLFVADPAQSDLRGSCLLPEPRARLLQYLADARVQFVASGHLHGYHRSRLSEIEIVWCPTTAFVDPGMTWPVEVSNRVGYLQWRFEGEDFEHRFVEPPLFANIDLTNWTRTTDTTINLPARPLARPA